jgi:hypothetical protein
VNGDSEVALKAQSKEKGRHEDGSKSADLNYSKTLESYEMFFIVAS